MTERIGGPVSLEDAGGRDGSVKEKRKMIGIARFRLPVALVLLAVVLAGASCSGLTLRKYRDDELLAEYRYTLGEQYAYVDGLRICYQEMGEGDTLLILPGLGTSIDLWQLNVPALAEEHHVVVIDLPGFGKSDKPDVDYDLAWIAEEVIAFMNVKGIDRASILGGSMGGHLALLIALEHPERVSKLVLMGSVGAWRQPSVWKDLGFKLLYWDGIVIDVFRSRWPAIHAKLFKEDKPFTQDIFRYDMALRANGKEFYPLGYAMSRAFKSISYSSCRDRLDEIACPVLLIWGQEDEIHPPWHHAVYFREHLPDARLVVVPNAAHEVMVDQSRIFNRLVLAFMTSGTAAIEDHFPPSAEKQG